MILPPSVRTLLFDFDGTLCHRRPSSLDVFFDLLQDTDVESNPQAKRKTRRFVHYYWANSPEFSEDFEAFGEMTSAFWERYLERKLVALGLDDDRAAELSSQLQPRMEERYQPVPWVPPDVHPTLVALRQEGYGLGLVSNRSMPIDDELDDLELAQYFNFQLTAGEINSWKPDQEIFEHALDLAQSTPRETSYIGDNYFTDVLGAQKMGLHTILVDPHGTFPDAECTVISSIGELMDDI